MASHLERIVYLNGAFVAGKDAQISIFDRGLLFADAVYEGLGVMNGHVVDFDMHMNRLERSLGELNIPAPLERMGILEILNTLIEKNEMQEGFVYFHITRGEADRDYVYSDALKPNVFAFMQACDATQSDVEAIGVKMTSHPDLRWKRRDIKTSNLLGQVIAKQAADDAGSYEALLVDDAGFVTEGASTSFFIVVGGVLVVRPVTNEILHGITRRAMLNVVAEKNLEMEERRFTLEEALKADEAFLTGASSAIEPVIEIDGNIIGSGKPGVITLALRQRYLEIARNPK